MKAMEILTAIRPKGWAASEVQGRMLRMQLLDARTPLTSIRRSLTDLTKAGKLMGPYTKDDVHVETRQTGEVKVVVPGGTVVE